MNFIMLNSEIFTYTVEHENIQSNFFYFNICK